MSAQWPLVLSGVVILIFFIVFLMVIIMKNFPCARQCVYELFMRNNCHSTKSAPLSCSISLLSLDERDDSHSSHRLLDKIFIDPESQESTSSIGSLLVDTEPVSFDLQEATRTAYRVPPQDSISTGSDQQQCNTTNYILSDSVTFDSNKVQASNTSLSDTTSMSSNSNINSNIIYLDNISTGSESQLAFTSSSNTSLHQQDNSSGNTIISPLPRIRWEYIVRPDLCASL